MWTPTHLIEIVNLPPMDWRGPETPLALVRLEVPAQKGQILKPGCIYDDPDYTEEGFTVPWNILIEALTAHCGEAAQDLVQGLPYIALAEGGYSVLSLPAASVKVLREL